MIHALQKENPECKGLANFKCLPNMEAYCYFDGWAYDCAFGAWPYYILQHTVCTLSPQPWPPP